MLRQAVGRRKKETEKMPEQFGSLAGFQFSTSAILFCEFDGLIGYRTTEKEGQGPMKAYNLVLGRFFEASVWLYECP